MVFLSRTSFYACQHLYICPADDKFYEKSRYYIFAIKCLLRAYLVGSVAILYKDKSAVLCGDGRCDSSGKSAKYCTYSLMDSQTNKILYMDTVDKRDVALKFPNMEREGFKIV